MFTIPQPLVQAAVVTAPCLHCWCCPLPFASLLDSVWLLALLLCCCCCCWGGRETEFFHVAVVLVSGPRGKLEGGWGLCAACSLLFCLRALLRVVVVCGSTMRVRQIPYTRWGGVWMGAVGYCLAYCCLWSLMLSA